MSYFVGGCFTLHQHRCQLIRHSHLQIGLVRFKSIKSVQGALSKFRAGEIVVQDVAVVVKALKSDENGKGLPPPADKSLSRHSSRAASPVVNELRLE